MTPDVMSEAHSSVTADLRERLERLEAESTELARHFDESQRILGMYYRAYKELENVVDRLVFNQDRIVEHLRLESPAQDRPSKVKWKGTMCPHGRRPYRCKNVECTMRRAASMCMRHNQQRSRGPVQNERSADDLGGAKTQSRVPTQKREQAM